MNNNHKAKILLVDDESHLLEILKQVVEAIGFQALCAQNGNEAFEIFLQEKPDMIISDIYMPNLNGLGLLKKIKQIDQEKPVVLMTGYAHYRQLVDKLDKKPDGFLEKPFDLKKIIEIILRHFPEMARK
jgi:two-component system response regulator AtoC